jgi:hypothetical protein
VDETIDALKRRILTGGNDRYERVAVARGTIAPESAKGASGILPQHF